MKFTAEREAIIREVSVAHEIISSSNNLSILSNVLLIAEGSSLTIKATDLKVSYETAIPVDVAVEGKTTVFCDKLLGILRALPKGDIEFEQIEGDIFRVNPLFKKIDFRLRSIPADKFPELQTAADTAYMDITQQDMIDMITQTVFAVSTDKTRYFMNGAFFEAREEHLVMVATDGRRLAYCHKPRPEGSGDFPGIIIPPKILQLIRKLASGEGPMSIAITEKSIFCRFDNQKISSALIEGQFPNYQRVIPKEQPNIAVVPREELDEALKRVSLLVEKSRRIYMDIRPGAVQLRSEESEVGRAEEEVSCEYDGPETTLALNYAYLQEPLRVIGGDELEIRFSEPQKAVTIVSRPEQDYFHIVMPMQLD